MEHLKELYLAIQSRINELKKQEGGLPNELLIELRLDIEEIIKLLCKENGIIYDGIDDGNALSAAIIAEELWTDSTEE